MKETMKIAKPMTIAREDLINEIVSSCNNSGLPFFVIESILREITLKVHDASIQQLELDRHAYEQAKTKENNELPQS